MKLRHIIYIAAALVAGACSEELDTLVEDGKYLPGTEEGGAAGSILVASPSSFDFSATTETGALRCDVTANGDWTVANIPEWITISPTYGSGNGYFSVLPDDNESFEPREATFTIKLDNSRVERTLTVRQRALSPYLRFEDEETYGYGSGTTYISAMDAVYEIKLNTNVSDIRVSFDYAWGNPAYDAYSKTIRFTVSKNNLSELRTGKLTVSSTTADKSLTVTFKQYAYEATLSEDAISFGSGADYKYIKLNSGMDWTVSTNNSWISVTPESGTPGSTDIKVSVLANSYYQRTGTVTVTAGDMIKKIAVTQEAVTLTTSRTEFNINYYGENLCGLYVQTTAAWKATTSYSWIKLRDTSGTGTQYLYFDVDAANSSYSRTGTIRIYVDGAPDIYTIVTICQEGTR